jgi:hypothetical protein
VTSLVVAAGFSSIINDRSLERLPLAHLPRRVAIIVPNAASPPIASTGMVSLP